MNSTAARRQGEENENRQDKGYRHHGVILRK